MCQPNEFAVPLLLAVTYSIKTLTSQRLLRMRLDGVHGMTVAVRSLSNVLR